MSFDPLQQIIDCDGNCHLLKDLDCCICPIIKECHMKMDVKNSEYSRTAEMNFKRLILAKNKKGIKNVN